MDGLYYLHVYIIYIVGSTYYIKTTILLLYYIHLYIYLFTQNEKNAEKNPLETTSIDGWNTQTSTSMSDETRKKPSLDFDEDISETSSSLSSTLDFKVTFISTHKLASRVAAFNENGKLLVTGSADTTIKLIVSVALLFLFIVAWLFFIG